jgi:hypothetical protein
MFADFAFYAIFHAAGPIVVQVHTGHVEKLMLDDPAE